jgi:hypothetical protein
MREIGTRRPTDAALRRSVMRLMSLSVAVAATVVMQPPSPQAEMKARGEIVDAALVLAVDVSGSINEDRLGCFPQVRSRRPGRGLNR